MKNRVKHLLIALALWSTLNLQPSTTRAQGTAFTYQGQLQNNGSPASGTYNLTFSLFNTNTTGVPVAGPVTNNAVVVTNGLFTTLVDFGPNVFTGTNYWLEISAETNAGGSFSTLAPRQQLTPTPYAIYAENVPASGIVGTLLDAQLNHSAVTVSPGPGLGGGGRVGLGNTIILTNTGVLSVAGNTDITAATVGGAVTLGDTATSTDTAGTLVKRDGSGNFSAATITLDGNLNLPSTAVSPDIIYSGTSFLLYDDNNGNSFIGASAGNSATSGIRNAANGSQALSSNTTGSGNTANGFQALYSNTSGGGNTANGFQALYSNTNGFYNTANGYAALFFNTSGNWNTANGFQALYYNTSGSTNMANGVQALYANVDGNNNTANGVQALYANNGDNNTANGVQALYSTETGNNNTANGVQALYYNFSGSGNTANGYHALFLNTSGSDNTANGRAALYNNTGGTQNTADGVQALNDNTSGVGNIALGFGAGYNITTGDYNIEISNGGKASDSGVIRIGTNGIQGATFIAGISGTTVASGVAVYVTSSDQLGVLSSSRRYKQDIQGMDQASDVLYALKPVTFKYKPGIDPQGIPQFGLVAEDVEKVAPDLVARDDQGKIYTVRYQAVDAMLLNEFLKEHRTVQDQSAEIQNQHTEIQDLKQRLEALEKIVLNQKSN